MLRLQCPNCGARNTAEFRFGGEYNPRPDASMDIADADWTDYLYQRQNLMGVQVEWWYHRAGCGLWFLAERDRRSNAVARTWRWQAGMAASEGAS